ncbi:MAG: hypothetical protein AAFV53_15445 [Myxococcota bacterium]
MLIVSLLLSNVTFAQDMLDLEPANYTNLPDHAETYYRYCRMLIASGEGQDTDDDGIPDVCDMDDDDDGILDHRDNYPQCATNIGALCSGYVYDEEDPDADADRTPSFRVQGFVAWFHENYPNVELTTDALRVTPPNVLVCYDTFDSCLRGADVGDMFVMADNNLLIDATFDNVVVAGQPLYEVTR